MKIGQKKCKILTVCARMHGKKNVILTHIPFVCLGEYFHVSCVNITRGQGDEGEGYESEVEPIV